MSSGWERNYLRFGRCLSEAVADSAADFDKDGQTSVLEAWLAAAQHVADLLQRGRTPRDRALVARRQWRWERHANSITPDLWQAAVRILPAQGHHGNVVGLLTFAAEVGNVGHDTASNSFDGQRVDFAEDDLQTLWCVEIARVAERLGDSVGAEEEDVA